MLFNYQTVHFEISSKCVLKCPRCPRTELDPEYTNQEISLVDFKKAFPSSMLSKIKTFIFCGDIGDPIYATDFLEIIEYIKHHSDTCIKITTNGSYKKPSWWKQLGKLLSYNDRVTFSVDGWDQDSNNLYRVNSNFNSIVDGIKALRSSSDCAIMWSTIYFNFNQNNIEQIRQIAQDLGCTHFQTVRSSKFNGRYSINGVDQLRPSGEYVANTLVYDTSIENINSNRYTPVVSAKPTHPHAWAKCLNYQKDLFIGVNGLLMPCPWFNSGYQNNQFVIDNFDRLSIKHRSYLEILNDQDLWQQLLDLFDDNPLEICKLKCKSCQ
jgi:MoaA/NifB/PqqE/SkfB family radical SAM enzyme